MIETQNLTKRYRNVTALDNLNLSVPEGQIFGYIGPNGAGKTTTLKILATLLTPTRGRAFVAGLEVGKDSRKIRPLIGYMPDFFGVYEDMTVDEYPHLLRRGVRAQGRQTQAHCGRRAGADGPHLQAGHHGGGALQRHAAAARPGANARA